MAILEVESGKSAIYPQKKWHLLRGRSDVLANSVAFAVTQPFIAAISWIVTHVLAIAVVAFVQVAARTYSIAFLVKAVLAAFQSR